MGRKTEVSYLHYIVDFIRFHGKRHPEQLGTAKIRDYLSHLATQKNVSASTQNVAFSAILFLYTKVLKVEVGGKDVKTTMIYTHVLGRGGKGVRSPLDS